MLGHSMERAGRFQCRIPLDCWRHIFTFDPRDFLVYRNEYDTAFELFPTDLP